MTVCIGIKDKKNHCCYVGADCGVSHSSFHTKTITPKVFHPYDRTDIVIGCAGSIRMANLLQSDDTMFEGLPEDEYLSDDKLILDIIQTVIPKIKVYAETLKKDDDGFDLILAVKDRLYRIQSDCSIYEVEEMEIIGSGCETAYGAMKMANSYDPYDNYKIHIESAINISAEYNYGITSQSTILKTGE
jgi:ATP-dependent protease HslVU (ClpYQ) peptidase subunit